MNGTRITPDTDLADFVNVSGDVVMDMEVYDWDNLHLKCSDSTIIRFRFDTDRATAIIVRAGRLFERVESVPLEDDVVCFRPGLLWVREMGRLDPELPVLSGPLRVRRIKDGMAEWEVADNAGGDALAGFDHEAHAMLFVASRDMLAAAEALIAAASTIQNVAFVRALEDLKTAVATARDC